MAKELTNREYVVEMLQKGRVLWRTTPKGRIIRYAKVRDFVCRSTKTRETNLSFNLAIRQLTRNFKELTHLTYG